MKNTPKGMRLHIGIYGRRNAGKSSLLNVITGQQTSIVSETPGTTTDPVEKPMELLPLGPVLFIDTAGLDDIGALGELRIQKTKNAIDRTDLAVVVTTPPEWGDFEKELITRFKNKNIPVILAINKIDLFPEYTQVKNYAGENNIPCLPLSTITRKGIDDFRNVLINQNPEEILKPEKIVGDLISPGELVVLVTPIDKEAPKGRLILPQVQTIRDILDHNAYCLVVKEDELKHALERLKQPPALVVTDSQAFFKVNNDTPPGIPLTSFSILFARLKGDLEAFVRGAIQIEKLKAGDHVLIAEACTHHPIEDDIGTIKIPRWLMQYVGGELHFTHRRGHDFPDNLNDYQLAIHCGACTFNPKLMRSRIDRCNEAGTPITNYGVTIAYTLGILDRALEPFPAALEVFRSHVLDK
ncbi:MAG: [FeFe] hydrogenase H-cluster maturation GTPase HydF [Calditrichaceae bacterium]|nr:[FeFe] hydrogenase H-cluster maturation GTPase HydF [Calditrichaceae bacterium]MBN2708666.1 [FeFe] hydrogenase H-cluster maturation GTPase HydF [Calditrichaceae bacterium]RQV96753.1 MAG: [FeFe] hydrogenase H-cluster maturation GTPase HydF [Calditrichota bacterium]